MLGFLKKILDNKTVGEEEKNLQLLTAYIEHALRAGRLETVTATLKKDKTVEIACAEGEVEACGTNLNAVYRRFDANNPLFAYGLDNNDGIHVRREPKGVRHCRNIRLLRDDEATIDEIRRADYMGMQAAERAVDDLHFSR